MRVYCLCLHSYTLKQHLLRGRCVVAQSAGPPSSILSLFQLLLLLQPGLEKQQSMSAQENTTKSCFISMLLTMKFLPEQ